MGLAIEERDDRCKSDLQIIESSIASIDSMKVKIFAES